MANKRFIDFPIATTVGDNDIILIWQSGANKQTTKATILSGVPDSLNDLTDVTISGLTNGQILRYDSVSGQWENTDQGNLDLNDLNDVTIVSPTNGQVLVYNSSTSKWENSSGGYVPYVGAVTTVNLGAQTIQAGSFVKQGGTSSQFLKADGSVDSTAYGTGSVTSVGLTMPSAFNVANSPITTAGTLTVTGAGTVAQYIRGDGSLADFPESSGGGSSVSYYLNGSVAQGTIGGIAYKELSKIPILGAGTDFTINADGYIASFITDAGDPNLLEIPGGNWNFETYFSASSGGGSPTFYVELYKVNAGGTATLIASSSTSPELIAFGTNLTPYFSSLAVPTTTLALTDRLAVRYYVTHSGRTITLHTENNHLCQIITTFTTGLTALNGLTAQVQNFSVGTTGTDFNIASAVSTHTFNLPTASATNRGALSSADWSMFNGKQNAITLTTTGTSGAATLVGATLNIPNYGSALSGYLPLGGGIMTGQIVLKEGTDSTDFSKGLRFPNDPYGGGSDISGLRLYQDGAGTEKMVLELYIGNDVTGSSQDRINFRTAVGLTPDNNLVTINDNIIWNAGNITPVPTSRTITINGTTQDLSANRTYNVGTVTSVTASSPLASSGGTTPNITIQQASGSQSGFLSSTDWTTFNSKQNALTNPVTGTGSAGQVAYWSSGSAITGESNLFWDSTNDRLGIGVPNPSVAKLCIVVPNSGSNVGGLDITNATNASFNVSLRTDVTEITAGGTGNMVFSNSAPRMIITSVGNIGIGANNPTAIGNYKGLTLDGSDGSLIDLRFAGSGNGRIFSSNDTAVGIESLSTTLPLVFKTQNGSGSLPRMYILPNGNVGIGTNSPNANSRLHVYRAGGSYDTIVADGDAGTNTGFAIYEGGSPRYALYSNGAGGNDSFNIYNFGAAGNSFTIYTSGNVGINSSSDNGARLQVNGGERVLQVTSSNDAVPAVIRSGLGAISTLSFQGTTSTNDFNTRIGCDANDLVALTANEIRFRIASNGAATFQSSVTAGLDSVFNGVNVGRGGGSISANTILGTTALNSNTTGTRNTAVGFRSLRDNTTGSQNTSIGNISLRDNTTGTNNTSVGYASMGGSTTGNSNSGFGHSSLGGNTTGANNSALGLLALGGNTTGTNNTAIGYEAGYVTNGSFANATSSNSVYIGSDTRASASGNTNEIVIGSGGRGQGSNSAVIGNSSITKTILNGNVGIGLIGPSGPLHIKNGSGELIFSKTNGRDIEAIFNGSRGNMDLLCTQLYISNLGTGTVYSNGGVLTNTNPSDLNLKTNVEPINYGLFEILKLNAVSFNWKNDRINQGKQYGFIAQEVEKIMPDLVKKGEYLGLDKEAIFTTLVKAIQELKQEIDTLKN